MTDQIYRLSVFTLLDKLQKQRNIVTYRATLPATRNFATKTAVTFGYINLWSLIVTQGDSPCSICKDDLHDTLRNLVVAPCKRTVREAVYSDGCLPTFRAELLA